MTGDSPKLQFAEIPRRFEKASLADFPNEHVSAADLDLVNDWLFSDEHWTRSDLGSHGTLWTDNSWRVLVITGPVGTSKTHLACAIAREYCKRKNAIFTTAQKMSRRIIEDRNANHFNKNSLLVIDEVNRSYDTKAEADRFFDLANHRYEECLPMVIVGNVQKSDLKELVGVAVADRIREAATFLTLTGESRRGQND
jgi:DNA replication protein DnaC